MSQVVLQVFTVLLVQHVSLQCDHCGLTSSSALTAIFCFLKETSTLFIQLSMLQIQTV